MGTDFLLTLLSVPLALQPLVVEISLGGWGSGADSRELRSLVRRFEDLRSCMDRVPPAVVNYFRTCNVQQDNTH